MAKKILVIDDDKMVGKSLEKLLVSMGYTPVVVASGEEAISYIKGNDCALIISDIRMPKTDGIDTIKAIRCLKPSIPEILITGYSDSESYEEAQKLKVSNFIYKPFDIEQIAQAIDKALNPEELSKPSIVKTPINGAEDFFGFSLPNIIKENYRNHFVFEKFNREQIMKVIDFTPPFLKTEKIVVLSTDRGSILDTKSLGMGFVTPKDTSGHYNETIFLAMCGWLMASTASVFLAMLFPTTAPQVVEANGIKPFPLLGEDKRLWKPASSGTVFFVESVILKKKLQLVIMKTTITFDNILYGVIEELKLMLTPKESIWSAKVFPSSLRLRKE